MKYSSKNVLKLRYVDLCPGNKTMMSKLDIYELGIVLLNDVAKFIFLHYLEHFH